MRELVSRLEAWKKSDSAMNKQWAEEKKHRDWLHQWALDLQVDGLVDAYDEAIRARAWDTAEAVATAAHIAFDGKADTRTCSEWEERLRLAKSLVSSKG